MKALFNFIRRHRFVMSDILNFLLVDDDAFVRDALVRVIHKGYPAAVVTMASNIDEAREGIERGKWDLVVLDLVLGKVNSLTLIRQLRAAGSATRILVLSALPETEAALPSLRAGANGFLGKDYAVATDKLCEAIGVVLAGGRFISEPLAEKLFDGSVTHQGGVLDALSAQEVKVFLALARGEPIKEISFALQLSEKTVRTYRARLFEKLQLKSDTDLIRFAMLNELLH